MFLWKLHALYPISQQLTHIILILLLLNHLNWPNESLYYWHCIIISIKIFALSYLVTLLILNSAGLLNLIILSEYTIYVSIQIKNIVETTFIQKIKKLNNVPIIIKWNIYYFYLYNQVEFGFSYGYIFH